MKKNSIFSNLKRIVVATLAVVMSLTYLPTTSVFASEVYTQSSGTSIQPLAETNFTKEEAISSLGLTEEEAKDSKIYVVSFPIEQGSNASITPMVHYYLDPDITFNFSPFTFSGSNGGSYWTPNANYIKWGVTFKMVDNPNNSGARLNIKLLQYGVSNAINDIYLFNTNPNGNFYISENWIPVTWGRDYRFMYETSCFWCDGIPTANVSMFVATKS